MAQTSHEPSGSASSDYYESLEARLIYRLLRGVKHFGYFPEGQEGIALRTAQRLMTAQVGETLALAPDMLVLDAGCGEGGAAIQLAQTRGVRVIGVDLLSRNVRKARRSARRWGLQAQVRFDIMDYRWLPLVDGSVDAAYTLETLVHIPEPKQALDELHRILKPAGRLALFEYTLVAEDAMTPEERSLADFILCGSGMPGLRRLTPGALGRLLKEAGFEDIAERDITPRLLPMFRRFYRRFWLPYQVLRLLKLRDRAVTVAAVVETYPIIMTGEGWRYVVVTCRKSEAAAG